MIDDSALIREAAKVALGAIGGWHVVTAASGEEGVQQAAAERFDAVLLDLVMPDMDGLAVAERLCGTAQAESPPIVLLTAQHRPAESTRFRELQIAAVITKPFDISGLSRDLARLLGWPT